MKQPAKIGVNGVDGVDGVDVRRRAVDNDDVISLFSNICSNFQLVGKSLTSFFVSFCWASNC